MPQVVAVDFARQGRPRPDKRHVAAEHIPELWQLVERHASEEAPGARDAGVFGDLERRPVDLRVLPELLEALLSIDGHRSELQHLEAPAMQSDSGLAEQHGRPVPRTN